MSFIAGTERYGGLPESQSPDAGKDFELDTLDSENLFYMLFANHGDCIRASILGALVASANTQPTVVFDNSTVEYEITRVVDSWFYLLAALKPDYRILQTKRQYVEYLAAYAESWVGQYVSLEEGGVPEDEIISLDAIAAAFFGDRPSRAARPSRDQLNEQDQFVVLERFVYQFDSPLMPIARQMVPAGQVVPQGPAIEVPLNYNPASMDQSLAVCETLARILPRAVAVTAWAEYASKVGTDMRKVVAYVILVDSYMEQVQAFLDRLNISDPDLLQDIRTAARILARPGDIDSIYRTATRSRVRDVISSPFGKRIVKRLTAISATDADRTIEQQAENEYAQLKTVADQALADRDAIEARLKVAQRSRNASQIRQLSQAYEQADSIYQSADKQALDAQADLVVARGRVAYKDLLSSGPDQAALDLLFQFARSVNKIRDGVIDQNAVQDAGRFAFAPHNKLLVTIDQEEVVATFLVEGVSEGVARRVQEEVGDALVARTPSVTDQYEITRDLDLIFIDKFYWLDLASFLYSDGSLNLQWAPKLAVEVDLQLKEMTAQHVGLTNPTKPVISLANLGALRRGLANKVPIETTPSVRVKFNGPQGNVLIDFKMG
jgi:hypothetical protein